MEQIRLKIYTTKRNMIDTIKISDSVGEELLSLVIRNNVRVIRTELECVASPMILICQDHLLKINGLSR